MIPDYSFSMDEYNDEVPPSESKGRIHPPFGYYGAKHRIANWIVGQLPPHNAWVEAFCGSAAVTLAKPQAPIEIINDLDGEIINLFKQLRENSDALCRAIALTPYSREEFILARESIENTSPIEKARRFLIASMMSVNGSIGAPQCTGFSCSPSYSRSGREARVSRWYNLPERLELVVERLRNVRIENRDALDLLKALKDRPATLIYLDPPYLMQRSHGYSVDANDEKYHHDLLLECRKSKAMILISGYDNELYNNILTTEHGWTRCEFSTHTRGTNGKIKYRTEVLWKNGEFVHAEETRRIPIRLSQEERLQNKVNPSRVFPKKPRKKKNF
jgi:DNA adenine methylase